MMFTRNNKKNNALQAVLTVIVTVALAAILLVSCGNQDISPGFETVTPQIEVNLDAGIIEKNSELMEAIDKSIEQHYEIETIYFRTKAPRVLGFSKDGDTVKVYLNVMYSYYGYLSEKREMTNILNRYDATAITMIHENGGYTVMDYWTSDGSDWHLDIKENFPEALHDMAIDYSAMYQEQKALCDNAAQDLLETKTYKELLQYHVNGIDPLSPEYLKINYLDDMDSFKKVGSVYLCGIDSIYNGKVDITTNVDALMRLCEEPEDNIFECDCGIKTNYGHIYTNEQYEIYDYIIRGCEYGGAWFWHSVEVEEQRCVFVVAKGSTYIEAREHCIAEINKGHEFIHFYATVLNAGYTDISALPAHNSVKVRYDDYVTKYPVYKFESYDAVVEFMNSDYKNYFKFNENLKLATVDVYGRDVNYIEKAPALADNVNEKMFEKNDLILIYVPVIDNKSLVWHEIHYKTDNSNNQKIISVSMYEINDHYVSEYSEGLFFAFYLKKGFVDDNTVFYFNNTEFYYC